MNMDKFSKVGMVRRQRSLLICLTMSLVTGMLVVGCHRKTPEEMLGEARQLYKNRDILSAELKYEEILKRFPSNEAVREAHLGLAFCYRSDNEFDRARAEYQEYIRIVGGPQTPEGFDTMIMSLETYLEQKKPEPEKALREALKTSETLRTAPAKVRQSMQLKITELYQINKQDAKAVEVCNQLIGQWPEDTEMHMAALESMIRIYVSKRDLAKTIEVYTGYLNKHPNSPNQTMILSFIGAFQKQLGKTAEAKAAFDASEQQFRNEIDKAVGADRKADLMIKLAKVQLVRQDMVRARQTLEKVIKDFSISKYRPVAKMRLAELSLIDKKPEQAIAMLQEVVRDEPNSQWSYMASQGIQQIRVEEQNRANRATTGTLTKPMEKVGTTSATLPKAQPVATAAAATPAAISAKVNKP